MQDKKTPEIAEFAPNCCGLAVRRAARAVSALFNAELKPYDMNLPQFGLLAAIKKFPGESLSFLSSLLSVDDSTLTRNLNVLKRRGLVRTEGGRGRAGLSIFVTEEGARLVKLGDKGWESGQKKLRAAFSEFDADLVHRMLQALEAAALAAADETEPETQRESA